MSKRSLIDSIEVKSPCSADWNAMTGSERVRFCSHCNLSVNNISTLTRKQAMRLVRESRGRICVRYIKNPVDNSPVFAERLYQITRRAGIAAGVLSASLTLSTLAYAQSEPVSTGKDSPTTQVSQPVNSDKNLTGASGEAIISGTVTDPNGALVPSMPVVLLNEKTNEQRPVKTNEEGFYEFKALEDGTYKLHFEGIIGLATKEIEAISVAGGANVQQDVTLDPNVTSMVTVGDLAIVEYRTELHHAVSNDDAEEVRNLILQGGKVNEKDENYSHITALFLAVENGNTEIAQMLLDFGAKINPRDDNRQTPLMRLDEDASVELVNLLIKHGARVNLVDREGNTALILAARSVKPEVLRVLIYHSANLDAQNAEGRTALMEAADADNAENVRALLEAGANPTLKDKAGETALDLTSSEEIENLLADYGAGEKEDSQ
ncbi:MAG TPA: ankyrin repeat domain-containing protein [Pyrinomonadaceae bacterium]|jgi:ankyrin repeat protein